MVKLRLRRRGRKRLPVYDIVAADSRSPRDGRIIEKVGQYSPLVTSGATMLNRERVTHWLKTGAQPTDTVRNILSREGILLALQMESKGVSSEEITAAVDAHVMRFRNREAVKANTKKVAAEETVAEAPAAEAEAAPEVAEAPAEETVAAEAPAEEAPVAEETAVEAPAAEENAGDSNDEEKESE